MSPPLRIHFDETASAWVASPGGPHRVQARQFSFDARMEAARGVLLVRDGYSLKGDGLTGLPGDGANLDAIRLMRTTPAPGWVNDPPMEDWCMRWNGDEWVIWRRTMERVHVTTTQRVDLDCEGVGVGGVLHMRAEMLLEGRTNRTETRTEAASVRMRTLRVFDQVVSVPIVGRSKAGVNT